MEIPAIEEAVVNGDVIELMSNDVVSYTPTSDIFLFINSDRYEVSKDSNNWFKFTKNTSVQIMNGQTIYLKALGDRPRYFIEIIDFVYNPPSNTGSGENNVFIKITDLGSNDDVFIGYGLSDDTREGKLQIGNGAIDLSIVDEDNYIYRESTGSGSSGGGTPSPILFYGARGDNSLALGASCIASGDLSVALGLMNISSGYGSMSFGKENISSGDHSCAHGHRCLAEGDYSDAEGYNNKSNGIYSHTEGTNNTADGYASHVEGYRNRSSGNHSHVEGEYSEADGNYSHAEGYGTMARGISSHSEGNNTETIGDYSHAEGQRSITRGINSHAEGFETDAIGNYSHAEGSNTRAEGLKSHAEGLYTIAQNYYMHASGIYNVGTSPDTTFEHGVGVNNHGTVVRKNGFELYKDGRVVAPELSTEVIHNASSRVLTTKEYLVETINAKTVGIEQEWQDFTNDRVFDTEYTNNTGKAIMINVSSTSGSNAWARIQAVINDFLIENLYTLCETNGSFGPHITIMVPNGAKYKVLGENVTIHKWSELTTPPIIPGP